MQVKRKRVLPGIYETVDGRYCVISQWVSKRDGRRKKRERMADTLEEAIAVHAELKEDPDSVRQQAITVADYSDSWFKTQGPRLARSTRERYAEAIAKFDAFAGDYRLASLTAEKIREWVASQIGTSAPATINGKLRIVRQVLETAVEDGKLPKNPAARVKPLPEAPTVGRRANSLNSEQLRSFVTGAIHLGKAGVLSPDLARMIVLAGLTGMRVGELVGLHWKDWDGECLTIRHSVYRGEVKSTKSRKYRRIPTPDALRDLLLAQKAWLEEQGHPGRKSGLVFPASPHGVNSRRYAAQGKPTSWTKSATTIRAAISAVVEFRDLPPITTHSLRRTFENLSREAGIDTLTRRSIAGWTTDSAQSIYADVGMGEQQRALRALLRISGLGSVEV